MDFILTLLYFRSYTEQIIMYIIITERKIYTTLDDKIVD